MTDLKKLSVSLTKHGAHKIAILLQQFDRTEVLNNLSGSVPSVNIDRAQAKKNLSVDSDNSVPILWDEVRTYPEAVINGLVLIAIIFSHHKLLGALAGASNGEGTFTGKIVNGVQLSGKAYTNFAHTLEELGFSEEHTSEFITYNLQGLFETEGLSKLAKKLITLKLCKAGWEENNTLAEELERLDLHKPLSISSDQMVKWVSEQSDDIFISDHEEDINDDEVCDFTFKAGYSEAKLGVTTRKNSKSGTVRLKHNELQKKLYEQLCEKYGEENVGTEVGTGYGTSVDAVVRTEKELCFYEIKTSNSAKACIREGLSQIMEYAYWSGKPQAHKLVIVSPAPENEGSERYLEYLRDNFNLPIFYEQLL